MNLKKMHINAPLTASAVDNSLLLDMIQSIFPDKSHLLSFCNFLAGMRKLKQLASIWPRIDSLQFYSVHWILTDSLYSEIEHVLLGNIRHEKSQNNYFFIALVLKD